MRNYILINNKRFMTMGKAWEPSINKPSQVRWLLSGARDTTYGPAVSKEWRGQVEAPVIAAPDPGDGTAWGTISDLRTLLELREPVTFVDHYGTSYSADLLGQFRERSLSTMWDAESNVFRIEVRLVV